MRLFAHLFLTTGCEAPGCTRADCGLYPMNAGRNLVRACNALHAAAAEEALAANDHEEN